MNIVEPILAQARYQPHAVAICAPGERHAIVTYAQAAAIIHDIARHAFEIGLRPGDTVAIFVDDGIMHALLMLGLAKVGIITISGRNPDLPREIKIDIIISDPGRTFSGGYRVVPIDASWMQGDGTPFGENQPLSEGDDICRIIFTSGTTGDAKGVAYSHRMVTDSHRMVTERQVRFDYLAGKFRSGWFYSGDIGSITKENLLIITGRQKTVMGGDKVKPEIIEAVLTGFPGVEDAGALGFVNEYGLEEVWGAIVTAPGIDMTQLHVHCQSRLPPSFVPRRFINVEALPKNDMGKIDRRRLQELVKTAQH